MDKVYKSLVYENAAGVRVVLSAPNMDQFWELRGRTGFSAPEVRLITEKYVNGNERIVNRIVEPRTVSINMIVRGKTSAIRDKVFFSMIDVLMDTSKGEIGKLYVTRSDGRTVILNCSYASGMNVEEQYRNFHIFTLEFYAADPYFYTLPDKQTVEFNDDDITLSDDLYLGDWRLGWGVMSATSIVTNQTGYEADPIYEIAGTRQSLEIRNHSLRKSLILSNLKMETGDVLVIDTRPKYKSVYIRHADRTIISALGSLSWSTISIDLPMPSGNSYITATTYGESTPLEITIMSQVLSA